MFINYPNKEKCTSRRVLKGFEETQAIVDGSDSINSLYKVKYTLLQLLLKSGQCLEWDFGHSSTSEMDLGQELDALPESIIYINHYKQAFPRMDAA